MIAYMCIVYYVSTQKIKSYIAIFVVMLFTKLEPDMLKFLPIIISYSFQHFP